MCEESSSSQTDFSMASEFAIRVALQTVKERCVSLHQRLQLLEEENQVLRSQAEKNESIIGRTASFLKKSDVPEVENLKQKVSQLSSQNQRLNEHIKIISKENNQLWSRLSATAKSKDRVSTCESNSSSRKQLEKESNLIRSRTFTQHSPNPNLRHTLVVPFESMSIDGEGDNTDEYVANHIASLQDMKNIASLQQKDLKMFLQLFQQKLLNQKCPKCTNKPETVEENQQTSILSTIAVNEESSKSTKTHCENQSDALEEIKRSDKSVRICPMCGQIFSQEVKFEDFVHHVELHFIDENEPQSDSDISLENNFEFITSTIGNF